MARLASSFWVQAYLARLGFANIPAYVVVKLNLLNGEAQCFQRVNRADGARIWAELARGDEAKVDAAIARQRSFDSDIWVIEVEDRAGRHLLDEPGLDH